MYFKVEYLIAHGADLTLAASKRDVAKGAKLTPRELAMEINPYVLKTKWWIANNIERFPKFHINNVHYKKRLKY